MTALDQLLRDLGTEILYSGVTGGLPIHSAKERLQEIIPLISEGQASIAEAKAARDNAAVQELNRAVAELEADRDAQLIVIGRAALAARRGNPATLDRIDRLQGATVQSGSSSRVTKVVLGTVAMITAGLLIVAGVWYFGGTRRPSAPGDAPAPLANRFNAAELETRSPPSITEDATLSEAKKAANGPDDSAPATSMKGPVNASPTDEPDDYVNFLPLATAPLTWDSGLLTSELRPAGEIDRRRGAPLPQLSVASGNLVMAVVGREGRLWNLTERKEVLRYEAAGTFWGRIRFALSPDGKLLAAIRSSAGGGIARSDVRVYDLQQRRWIWKLSGDENTMPVGLGDLSFSSDGGKLIGTGEVGKGAPVYVWDAATGREILALPKDSPLQRVQGQLTERDTRNWLQLRNRNGTECVLYDLRTGKLAHTLPIGAEEVRGFSADGKLVVIQAGRDVQCLDLTSSPARTVWTVSGRRASLILPLSNQVLITGGDSLQGDFAHDLLTGAEQYRWRQSAAGFSTAPGTADGQILVLGSGLHDARSGTLLASLPIDHGNEFNTPYLISTQVTANEHIVSLERNGRVAVWNPSAIVGRDLVRAPTAVWKLNDSVTRVAASPDGQRVAILAERGPLRVFAGATAAEFPWSVPIENHSPAPRFIAEGQRIVGMKAREPAAPALPIVWNSATGQSVTTLFSPGDSPRDRADLLACSPDGRTVALRVAQDSNTRLRFLRTETAETVSEVDWPASALATGQFTTDGSRFSLATANGAIIHDVTTGDTTATISFSSDPEPTGAPSPASSFPILAPDGLTLLRLFGRSDLARKPVGGTVEVWDVATRRRVRTLNLGMPVSDAFFLEDGQTVASTTGRDIRLWDLTTGALRGVLIGHDHNIQSLDYAPRSRTFVSAGHDATVCFWNRDALPAWQPESMPSPVLLANRPAAQPLFPPRGITPPLPPTGSPAPTSPSKPTAKELTPDQVAARKMLLDKFAEDTLLRGEWSIGKYSGRFSLRVTRPADENLTITAEAFDPSKSKETKDYVGQLEYDDVTESWLLVWQAVAESGLRRNPSRLPATTNLLLFGDQRTIRLKLVNGEWLGKDSSEVSFRFKVVDIKIR